MAKYIGIELHAATILQGNLRLRWDFVKKINASLSIPVTICPMVTKGNEAEVDETKKKARSSLDGNNTR